MTAGKIATPASPGGEGGESKGCLSKERDGDASRRGEGESIEVQYPEYES